MQPSNPSRPQPRSSAPDFDFAPGVVRCLRNALPAALGIYAFGSRVNGAATTASDLDLAVLVPGYVEPLRLWEISRELADEVGCEVDLLDLRAAISCAVSGWACGCVRCAGRRGVD